jgi:hypothetical protein
MVCPKCGQANADNLNFCSACGQKLEAPSGVQPLQAPNYASPPAAPLSAPAPLYSPPPGPQPLTGEPLPQAAPAQMQCRVCGTVLTPRDYSCPRCSTPVGMDANPNDPTAASYLPVGGYQPMFENTSGQKSTVPPEIAAFKWNWGAFLMNWLWLCFHGMVLYGIGLLVVLIVLNSRHVGFLGLAINIYLGINGHKLAWKNRRFESIEQYKKVETAWMRWGIALAIIGFLLVVAAIALLLPAFIVASQASR